MSYSFSVKADNKIAAAAAVRDELAKVVASQPTHAKDRDQAQAAAEAIIGVLADDDTKDIGVTVSGYLSWNLGEAIHTANVQVTASLRDKAA